MSVDREVEELITKATPSARAIIQALDGISRRGLKVNFAVVLRLVRNHQVQHMNISKRIAVEELEDRIDAATIGPSPRQKQQGLIVHPKFH